MDCVEKGAKGVTMLCEYLLFIGQGGGATTIAGPVRFNVCARVYELRQQQQIK